MNTAYTHGPILFALLACRTKKGEARMRAHCLRLEAYDMDDGDQVRFLSLQRHVSQSPEAALALAALHLAIARGTAITGSDEAVVREAVGAMGPRVVPLGTVPAPPAPEEEPEDGEPEEDGDPAAGPLDWDAGFRAFARSFRTTAAAALADPEQQQEFLDDLWDDAVELPLVMGYSPEVDNLVLLLLAARSSWAGTVLSQAQVSCLTGCLNRMASDPHTPELVRLLTDRLGRAGVCGPQPPPPP